MADNPLQFADFGNALLAGSQAAYYGGKASQEREAEKRRTAAQPFIEPAVRGDMGAFAKVAAGDPATATAVAQALSRMDASTLAKAKAATDYTTGVTTGLLAAPPADQERLYQMTRADAQAKGMDISRWPANFDAPWVQMQNGIGVGAKTWFEQQQQNQRHATPSGGAQTLGYMDGKGGAAPTGAPGASGPPVDLVPHFKAASSATGLPEKLLYAVGGVESAFKPNATSPAGADGIMQLMPGTARDLGVANTRDPASNILGGSTYLKQQLDKYGNLETALAAYNWGPGNVDAWLKSGADPARLPTETRNYIAEVKRRLGAESPTQTAQATQPAQMPSPATLIPSGPPPAQMPSVASPPGPPPAAMPQVGGPARGVPGPIAQGDTPQADASGTPMPPAGAQQGQLPIQGDFAMEDPKPYGYRMLARVTNGVPVPLQSADGHYIYEDPQTKRTVLYKPRPVEAAPTGYRAGPNGSLVAIPGGPADKSNGAGGPFPGQSVEANALNMLIADGTLTKNQAAQLAAGKTITNPADGSVMFMTPEGLFQRQNGQAPAPVAPQQTAPTAPPTSLKMPTPPGAAPPASQTPPGMISITPPKPQVPNNEQARDQGFADRMTNSDRILGAVAGEGQNSVGRLQEKIPFGAGNFLQSKEYQSFKQARDDFINAQLRRESGSAIHADEYDKADKQYFPIPGDKPETIKQKALNRRIAVEAMIKSGGASYRPRAAEPADPAPTGDRPPLSSFER